ncbi:MAG TPA: AMP-binding protein, partial [Pseudonocardiaceae bacterium]|nr:AMP-binding protein [Pseudonocardiaceae bacterium]
MLFPRLAEDRADDRLALHFGARTLTYQGLAGAAARLVPELARANRVAVWATPTMETAVAVVGALFAGAAVIPLNPKTGERELAHILADSEPDLVLAEAGAELPGGLGSLWRVDVDAAASTESLPAEPADLGAPAFIVYTSGTTGEPKGVVHSRLAIASNLDA